MSNHSYYFEDISSGYFENKIIFLDIDGTLLPDGNFDFDSSVIRHLEGLKQNNKVFLCTNSGDRIRSSKIETALGLPIVTHNHKKPSLRIIENLGIKKGGGNLLVIGDKFLTDGLFALNIGAEFVKVGRKISGKESLDVKIVNFLDNILWQMAKFVRII